MAVSNPASFSSIKAEFGGSNSFSDYYRGGPYVTASASSTIATTAASLRMSQFNGVSKPVTAPLTLSATNGSGTYNSSTAGVKSFASSTATVSGGSGTYSYSCVRKSGSTNATVAVSGNIATFRISVAKAGLSPGDVNAVYTWTVSDGSSSISKDVTVTGTDVNG